MPTLMPEKETSWHRVRYCSQMNSGERQRTFLTCFVFCEVKEVKTAIPWKPRCWKAFKSSEAPAPEVGSYPATERRIFFMGDVALESGKFLSDSVSIVKSKKRGHEEKGTVPFFLFFLMTATPRKKRGLLFMLSN